jgi:squalene-associated FAD-dependent desaturase
MNHPSHVAVIGGGLAGLAAALDCADAGARVTLLERRSRLGGLTWSFQHAGRWVDNGQHVFLRCCDAYLSFLDRIGAASDVELPDRLDIPVVAPAAGAGGFPRIGRLRRSDLPAPFHLLGSLLRYPHLPLTARLGLGRAVVALRRLDLDDPALDGESFGAWLARHGQSAAAVAGLWDLITVPTVNLPASEASLAMAAKVFQTGLLSDTRAADIGWSRVPLGQLHGARAGAALAKAGVEVRLGAPVLAVRAGGSGESRFAVETPEGSVAADGVIVAVPHDAAGRLLPPGSVPHQDRLVELGASAIVDVHLVFDRPVTRWPLLAGLDSPVQWVFDRTASSGLDSSGLDAGRPGSPRSGSGAGPQYVAVSISAADDLLGRHPEELVPWITGELTRLLPAVAGAQVVESLVTKERNATFRARPGTAQLRPGPRTARAGLAVAGAWTDTGWPATMEGAVRSGRAAASVCLPGAGRTARSGAGRTAPSGAGRTAPSGAGAGAGRSPIPIHTEEVA